MAIFNLFPPNKKSALLQIGMSENDQHRCLVWRENDHIQVDWQPKTSPLNLLQAVGYKTKITLIRTVPHHYIWRKALFLPIELNLEQCYKQIIQILNNELPVPLAQVYFDYIIETDCERKIHHIRLYALRKIYASQLLTEYPTILDCELHCYLRSFQQLNSENNRTIYQINTLIFQQNGDDIQILHKIENKDSANIIKADDLLFPENTLDKSLYLLALGASLWH